MASLTRHSALALVFVGVVPACHKEEPPRVDIANVERCENGIDKAERQPTLEEGLRVFDQECAGVYVEALCRNAVTDAAKAPRETQISQIATACRKAYCPILPSADEMEICEKDFQPTRESLERTWPGLNNAIIAFDGKALAPRISDTMFAFYVRTLKWPTLSPAVPAGSASAGAPAGSASAGTPAGSASAGTPAVSASAGARAASASATHSAVPAPSASAH